VCGEGASFFFLDGGSGFTRFFTLTSVVQITAALNTCADFPQRHRNHSFNTVKKKKVKEAICCTKLRSGDLYRLIDYSERKRDGGWNLGSEGLIRTHTSGLHLLLLIFEFEHVYN